MKENIEEGDIEFMKKAIDMKNSRKTDSSPKDKFTFLALHRCKKEGKLNLETFYNPFLKLKERMDFEFVNRTTIPIHKTETL